MSLSIRVAEKRIRRLAKALSWNRHTTSTYPLFKALNAMNQPMTTASREAKRFREHIKNGGELISIEPAGGYDMVGDDFNVNCYKFHNDGSILLARAINKDAIDDELEMAICECDSKETFYEWLGCLFNSMNVWDRSIPGSIRLDIELVENL